MIGRIYVPTYRGTIRDKPNGSQSNDAREEARLRIVQVHKSNIGRKTSRETKEKLKVAMLGNTHCLGKKLSTATKDKIRKARLGLKLSAGTKAKISEARLRYWQKRKAP